MIHPDAVESSTIAEMEETIARISAHKGVEGVMIMDRRGAMRDLF
jgi:tagatose-1,6-bisphosphate aldolase